MSAPSEAKNWLLQMESALNVFCDSPEKCKFLQLRFLGRRITNATIGEIIGVTRYRLTEWRQELLTLVGENTGMIARFDVEQRKTPANQGKSF